MANEPSPELPLQTDAPPAPAPITIDAIKQAGIPDTYLKDGVPDFAGIAKDLGELSATRTSQAERAKLIPADGKYSFDLPKEWKAPEGTVEGFTWTVSDAKREAFAPIVKDLGLSQEQVSGIVQKWATADAMEAAAQAKDDKKHFDTEMAKLGNGVEQRLGTLFNSLKGAVGEDGAKEISLALNSAAAVEAIEKLIALAGGPKLAAKAVSGNGKEQPDIDFNQPGVGDKLHRLARPASRQ